jgi:hypothetical protein
MRKLHPPGAKAHICVGPVTARDPLRGFPEPCPCFKTWIDRVFNEFGSRAFPDPSELVYDRLRRRRERQPQILPLRAGMTALERFEAGE